VALSGGAFGQPALPNGRAVAADAPQGGPSGTGRIYYHDDLELVAVKPDGADAAPIPRLTDGEGLDGNRPTSARLGPEGTRMGFVQGLYNQRANRFGNVCMREIGKPAPAELLAEPEGDWIAALAWSPEGSRLAFTTWDPTNSTRNWVVDAKTKRVEELKLP